MFSFLWIRKDRGLFGSVYAAVSREKRRPIFQFLYSFICSFFSCFKNQNDLYKQINYGSDTLKSEDFIWHSDSGLKSLNPPLSCYENSVMTTWSLHTVKQFIGRNLFWHPAGFLTHHQVGTGLQKRLNYHVWMLTVVGHLEMWLQGALFELVVPTNGIWSVNQLEKRPRSWQS